MVKRELVADTEIDVDAPRTKRHRDVEQNQPVKASSEAPEKRGNTEGENEGNAEEVVPSMSVEEVREEGLKVLQVLKDTVNKEGRQLSYEFLRLPSKRQFPDYYQIIERPIALDDIKAQLEDHAYPSLEALRTDLEACFKNARRYNQRESVIWRDAKSLQKLANKEIDKILRKGDEDDGSDKEDGKKKEKGVNIHRLMKNRLQKLVEKADDSGRRYSDAFMDLPSKKKWPVYYKLIKRPLCIEDIFMRIKGKKYKTISDFINDVDLVLDNAMSFNEDHSPIWEDASFLKAYFHQLMSVLPAKYNSKGDMQPSEFPEGHHNKIKLKLPGHQTIAQGSSNSPHAESSSATVRLRVPGMGVAGSGATGTSSDKETHITPPKKAKVTSPAAPSQSLPSAKAIPNQIQPSASPPNLGSTSSTTASTLAMPSPKPAKTGTPAQLKTSPPVRPQQQHTAQYGSFHQYTAPNQIPSQNFYAPATATPAQTPSRSSATPAPVVPQPTVITGRTDAPSPVPSPSAAGIYSVRLECCAKGKAETRRRLAILDNKAGVRNFAVHVPITDTRLIIRSIRVTSRDADGDGSEAEGESKNLQSPKKRGRGRPRKIPIDQEVKPDTEPSRSSPAPILPFSSGEKREKQEWREATSSEVEVKVDGKEVKGSVRETTSMPTPLVNGNAETSPRKSDSETSARGEHEWSIELTPGQHSLEIARKVCTVPWRVYLSVS